MKQTSGLISSNLHLYSFSIINRGRQRISLKSLKLPERVKKRLNDSIVKMHHIAEM